MYPENSYKYTYIYIYTIYILKLSLISQYGESLRHSWRLNQVCNPFSAPMSSAISSCGTRVATMLTPGRARKGLGWVNDSDLTATEPWCHGLIARNHPQMVLFHIDYYDLPRCFVIWMFFFFDWYVQVRNSGLLFGCCCMLFYHIDILPWYTYKSISMKPFGSLMLYIYIYIAHICHAEWSRMIMNDHEWWSWKPAWTSLYIYIYIYLFI